MLHLRTVFDVGTKDDLVRILARARELKRLRAERALPSTLKGRVVGMLFERPSTRTRASFESGTALLGGSTVVLHGRDTQLHTEGEALRDMARVLGSYVDAVVARAPRHAHVEELARHAHVPVVNGLSELDHPCQVITDLFTVFERKEKPFDVKWAYVGEAQGTCNGLVALAAIAGIEVALALPAGQSPDAETLRRARAMGARVSVGTDPAAAVDGAGVVSTDAWASLDGLTGAQRTSRANELLHLQVNGALLARAHDDSIVLHPLPARRGFEITDDVLEGMHSVAFQQAGNRLPVQQALLERLLAVPA
jgi:ornithine carbamoyltransferase